MKPTATIIGGGIIGLSIAYELLNRGWEVTVVERNRMGKAATWAAAGILLPSNRLTAEHPLEHLSALSNSLHEEWSRRLEKQTGINNGFHRCGGLYIGRTAGEVAALTGLQFQLEDQGIAYQVLNSEEVSSLDFVATNPGCLADVRKAVALVDESQVCNPHHTNALVSACQKLGGDMRENAEVISVERHKGSIRSISLKSGEKLTSDQFIFTTGAWTEKVLGFEPLPLLPIRGQMVMFKLPKQIFEPIIYEGSHYLVPRRDGHVLAGATIEEAGFDLETTDEAISMLMAFAERQFPQLNSQTKVKHWAGLRPTTFDGFPYLGRARTVSNGWIAAGHFRLGIQLSTGTAVTIADLLEEKPPKLDLAAFNPSRIVD